MVTKITPLVDQKYILKQLTSITYFAFALFVWHCLCIHSEMCIYASTSGVFFNCFALRGVDTWQRRGQASKMLSGEDTNVDAVMFCLLVLLWIWNCDIML